MFLLVSWLLLALYIGAGGWVAADVDRTIQEMHTNPDDTTSVKFDDITYANRTELRRALLLKQRDAWFPWLSSIPTFLGLLLTAIAFGSVGGVIHVVKGITFPDNTAQSPSIFLHGLFGGIIGLLLLGLSYVLPTALTTTSSDPHPTSLFFLCLFGGMFSEKVHAWLGSLVDSIFPTFKKDQ